jgi:hypothetical protein
MKRRNTKGIDPIEQEEPSPKQDWKLSHGERTESMKGDSSINNCMNLSQEQINGLQ